MKYLILCVIAGISFMWGCTVEPDKQDLSGIFQYNVEITTEISDNKHPIPHGDEMLLTIKIDPKDYYDKAITFPTEIESDGYQTYFAFELRPTTGEIFPESVLTDDQKRKQIYRSKLESYDSVKRELTLYPVTAGTDTFTTSVYLRHAYGKVRVFAKGYLVTYDNYEKQISSIQALDATGSTNVINFQDLTIYDTQLYERAYTGTTVHLEGENLHVIETTGTGMYLVDIDFDLMGRTDLTPEEEVKFNQQFCMLEDGTLNPDFVGYNAMYIYSHSAPENYTGESAAGAEEEDFEAVKSGDKVNWITGNLSEFLEMSEISFPVWEMDESLEAANPNATEKELETLKDSKRAEMVAKMDTQVCTIGDDLTYYPGGVLKEDSTFEYSSGVAVMNLERFESNVIRITDVVIGEFDPDNRDYKQYSQWQVLAGNCSGFDFCPRFRVVSRDNAAEFDAMFAVGTVAKGTHLKSVTGVLHQVYDDTWVLYARSCRDIVLDSGQDACTAN